MWKSLGMLIIEIVRIFISKEFRDEMKERKKYEHQEELIKAAETGDKKKIHKEIQKVMKVVIFLFIVSSMLIVSGCMTEKVIYSDESFNPEPIKKEVLRNIITEKGKSHESIIKVLESDTEMWWLVPDKTLSGLIYKSKYNNKE